MVATRDKHRRALAGHLEAGETLQALINVNDGGPGGGVGYAQARASATTGGGDYRVDHGIAEKGLNGHADLADVWRHERRGRQDAVVAGMP